MAQMATYTVFIDDNFHYMDKEARVRHGEFETLEAAVAACRAIVDGCLETNYEPGMSAEALYSAYKMFGEDPWVSGSGNVGFSAWTYAKERCGEVCKSR
jgi:hypothetical protein